MDFGNSGTHFSKIFSRHYIPGDAGDVVVTVVTVEQHPMK